MRGRGGKVYCAHSGAKSNTALKVHKAVKPFRPRWVEEMIWTGGWATHG